MDNIGDLPSEIAAYKATEKSNDSHIVFHGELSPYSNFHHSPFKSGGNSFLNAEQYMQYHKALFFGDTETGNKILQAENPYGAKCLSYLIKDVD